MYLDIERILAKIPDGARVLDLGGWANVFPRANVVVDLMSYETRTITCPDIPEHFTRNDWIRADFCGHAFWDSIPDKAFDFITIGHTLEDIRDPLFVCSQMIRCGKAGYIEAPSKVRELSKLNAADSFPGYAHHRWIIEPMPDLSGLIFKAKLAWAYHGDFLGDARRHLTRDYFHHFSGYFWEGAFKYVEHFCKAPHLECEDARWFFDGLRTDAQRRNVVELLPNQTSPDDGRCLWVTEYEMPSEMVKRTGRPGPLFDAYGPAPRG
jgi:hypothetical protein